MMDSELVNEFILQQPQQLQSVEIDGTIITPNQNPKCLTLIQHDPETNDWDAIHICDWPKLREAINKFQEDRKNARVREDAGIKE